MKNANLEWIPISDNNLPDDGTWNLFTDGMHISLERYKLDAVDHFCPNGRYFGFDHAIAWMPLPGEIYFEAHEIGERGKKITKGQAAYAIKHVKLDFSVKSSIDLTKYKREIQEILDQVVEAQIKAIDNL